MMDERKLMEQGLPESRHAEMTILGAMLVDSLVIPDATLVLTTDDFVLDSHRRIYSAILRLAESGMAVDIVTVSEDLRKHKELDAIGGVPYIAALSEGLPRRLSIESYVRIVRDKAQLRRTALTAQNVFNQAVDQGMESGEVLERAIEDLRTIALDNDTSQMIHVSDVFDRQGSAEEMFENMASKNGVPLGWNQFDEVTDGGVHPGELVVVAARPSMGKTAWACNAARSTSVVRKKVTAFFPLEQPKEAMIRRMLSASACIDYKDIRRNTLRLQDRRVLLEHREILRQAPLYFDDTPGLTVSRIKARCMQLKARHGLDIAFIDQLSKIKGTDVYRKGMQPREIVGAQTEALKLMAQELGIPVVVFNQLSRKTGDRKDAIPTLSDLKESGDIEEDADLVCLLHRPEYYDKSDPSLHGIGQMIIAKQREGETKTLNCLYQGRIMRWEDDTEPPPAKQSSFSSHDSYYDRPPAWEAYEGI